MPTKNPLTTQNCQFYMRHITFLNLPFSDRKTYLALLDKKKELKKLSKAFNDVFDIIAMTKAKAHGRPVTSFEALQEEYKYQLFGQYELALATLAQTGKTAELEEFLVENPDINIFLANNLAALEKIIFEYYAEINQEQLARLKEALIIELQPQKNVVHRQTYDVVCNALDQINLYIAPAAFAHFLAVTKQNALQSFDVRMRVSNALQKYVKNAEQYHRIIQDKALWLSIKKQAQKTEEPLSSEEYLSELDHAIDKAIQKYLASSKKRKAEGKVKNRFFKEAEGEPKEIPAKVLKTELK